MLGRDMLTSLKRGLGLWWTRTIDAEEQSEDVEARFALFLEGVRVIQHMLLLGRWLVSRSLDVADKLRQERAQ